MTKFDEYSPPEGSNWNAMTGVGGVWIRDGETACIRCPQCAKAMNLGAFTIGASGIVLPQVECPECKWSDFITLAGWDERFGKWWRPKFFDWKIGNASEKDVEEESKNLSRVLKVLLALACLLISTKIQAQQAGLFSRIVTTDPSSALAGGTAAADGLNLKATTGNGVGSEFVKALVGNNGAIIALNLMATVSQLGHTASPTTIITNKNTPGGNTDGMWWVECSGTSPTRTCDLKINDSATVRTIATVTF